MNKTQLNDNKSLTRAQIAKHYKVLASSINGWLAKGCPRNPDKTYDLEAVNKWYQTQNSNYNLGATLRQEKTKADIERVKKQNRDLDFQYQKAQGLVHSKEDCSKSLTEVLSANLQPLLSLGSRIAAQFPELGKRLKDAIDIEVDNTFENIRQGLSK